MHHITRGVGKPLLLIHGLGSSWRAWQLILDDLAAERSVIAIDLPGHGATAAEQDSGTFEGLVGSVERYLVANDLVGIDVVGSSMGARIVLELARRGKAGNVVSLDPGGFWRGWERSFFRTTIGLSAKLLRVLRSRLPVISRSAAARAALLAQLSAKPAALPPELVCTELTGITDTATFDSLVDDLATAPRALTTRVKDLEAEERRLEKIIAATPASPVVRLPANYESLYTRAIAELDTHLASTDGASARQTIRPLIEKIVVQPGSARGGKRRPIQLYGDLYRMLAFAEEACAPNAQQARLYRGGAVVVWMVAGTGFEPVTFRL
ncbi:alpha/beta fold hydrolase [Sphingomonas sp. LR60]|uniref:alpha/beta fold hydrolase n=1 Tax=Sphingomonas sp. LR60 TaxID=3050233 RepID=UPI002FE1531E